MKIDMRKKGCPNTSCIMNKKKKFQDNKNKYCPECGTKLVYVCTKCFKEIEDINVNHKICYECEEKARNRKQTVKDGIINGATGVVKVATSIAVPAAAVIQSKVIEKGTDGLIKVGIKAIDNVAKVVIKK